MQHRPSGPGKTAEKVGERLENVRYDVRESLAD